VDAADFNNDGRSDVFVADMLPEREDVLKTSASSEGYNLFNLRLRAGYHPQYARNTLQLNRGDLRFSDVGYLAGVFASDWSWAALFADLDNDGWKDLVVTSGIYRRPNDLDYINYVGNEAVQAALARGITKADLELLQRMPQIPLPNHIYRNNGDLTFTDVAVAWGAAQPGFSNGAAYVDLDNDGALDLVINRLNAPAAVYRSRARDNGHAYLTVTLRGSGANTAGIGARVTAVHGASRQVLEQMPTRGFQSSVDQRLHFGLGSATRVDSLIVRWPEGRIQILTDVAVNRAITLVQDSATPGDDPRQGERLASAKWLDDVTREFPEIRHHENAFIDYEREPLMPHVLSTEGPALAIGDVNGDGLDDMFVGGAKWQAGRLLIQRSDGSFRDAGSRALGADSLAEDVDAVFVDADGDGDLDLYVVSGGNEFWGEVEALRDRLYLNDGRGELTRAADALPRLYDTGGCVAAADYDGDGDTDLFVGSRVVPRRYGEIPESRLLQNDGAGRFRDATQEVAPALQRAGMVAGAAWTDVNGDGALDLVVVGEWMPVRVFRQDGGRLVESTDQAGLGKSHGWWNSVSVADVNADGHPDLLLGNLGLNSYLRAGPDKPAQLHVYDFGGTGSLKQVLTFYKGGVSYPLPGRDDLVRLIPSLRSRYPTYADFGASRFEDIFAASERARATVLEAGTFASAVAIGDGRGAFALQPLPNEAQLAPVYAVLPLDVDGDGRVDVLAAGNFYGVPPMLGRYDGSYGALLRNEGGGALVPFPAGSLPALDGEVRDLKVLRHASGGTLIVVARNNAALQFLRLRDER
jgi:enediyne biosynthesis protein E4